MARPDRSGARRLAWGLLAATSMLQAAPARVPKAPAPGVSVLDAAQLAIREKEFARAARGLERAAAAGTVEAQYLLASLLLTGALGEPDPRGALRWFTAAAEAGHARAAYSLSSWRQAANTRTRRPPHAG
jgi:TPR repeat protein